MKSQIEFFESKLNNEIDSYDLRAVLKASKNVVVIDVRNDNSYSIEHIPSAINLYHQDISEASTKNFDKTKVYVCYCIGVGCNASTKAALKLAHLGFTVNELIGGLACWIDCGFETHVGTTEKAESIECDCVCQ
jgi:rhodanese-related sulfurtransferase